MDKCRRCCDHANSGLMAVEREARAGLNVAEPAAIGAPPPLSIRCHTDAGASRGATRRAAARAGLHGPMRVVLFPFSHV
eukprot:scaffold1024_cov140-Isochrysis_galbana.AAC.1